MRTLPTESRREMPESQVRGGPRPPCDGAHPLGFANAHMQGDSGGGSGPLPGDTLTDRRPQGLNVRALFFFPRRPVKLKRHNKTSPDGHVKADACPP